MDLKKLVNQSGFPLQIAVQNLVASDGLDWNPIYSEHSWKHPVTGDSGFIDLVVEWGGAVVVLIVECKRVLDTTWVFFNSNGNASPRRIAKGWYSEEQDATVKYFGWRDVALDPACPECEYSIAFGHDSKSKPMLEREASILVSATESFAHEEVPQFVAQSHHNRLYLNVLVTTAKLQVCTFDPNNISIADGTLNDCEFIEVPYVRFRKQVTISHDLQNLPSLANHRTIAKAKENTVFVVNAEKLSDFLQKFDPDPLGSR
jgi:hypothetical protein